MSTTAMTTAMTIWLDISLRGAVLLLLAWGLAFLLRRFPGQLRYRLWSVVFLGLLLLPLLSIFLPTWRAPLPTLPTAESVFPVAELSATAVSETEVLYLAHERLGISGSVRRMPWESILLALWTLGALVGLGRLAGTLARATRVAHRGRPLDEGWSALLHEAMGLVGLGRRVRLLESTEVATPMTGGLLRPVVLLPPTSRAWTPERRRLVLLHELVHVRRGDWLLQIAARMACALHWWNPLVWLAGRRLELERETACDEAVLDLGTRPSEYASHLLAIAENLHAKPAPALASLAMAQPKQLEGRLMSILTPRSYRSRAWHTASLFAGMASLVLLLATFELQGEPAPETPSSAEEPSSGSDESSASLGHAGWTARNWTMNITRDDGLRFTVRVHGAVRFGEDGSPPELGPGAVLEIETQAEGHDVRLEIVGGTAGETTENLWIDGATRPMDDNARGYRDAAFAALKVRQEIGALRGQEGALRGQIGALRGVEGALRGKIGALRGREGALRGEIGALRGQVGAMRGEIGALRGHAGAMKGQMGALRGQLGALRAQRRHLEGEGNEAVRKAEMEAQASALEAEIREIQAQLADFDLEAKVAEVETRIAEFDTAEQEREIEEQLAALDTVAEIAEIEREIEALSTEAEVAEIVREIEALAVEEREVEIESRLDAHFGELRRAMEELVP